MSQKCELCNKIPLSGNIVSHSHKKTRRRWLPNLQKTKIMKNGKLVSVKICASCLKSQLKG